MIIDVVEFLLYREREREREFFDFEFNCTYLEIKRKRNIIDVAEL